MKKISRDILVCAAIAISLTACAKESQNALNTASDVQQKVASTAGDIQSALSQKPFSCATVAEANLVKKGFIPLYSAKEQKGIQNKDACLIDVYGQKNSTTYLITQEISQNSQILSFDENEAPFGAFEIKFTKDNLKKGVIMTSASAYAKGVDIAIVTENKALVKDFATLAKSAKADFVMLNPKFINEQIGVSLEQIGADGNRVTLKSGKF